MKSSAYHLLRERVLPGAPHAPCTPCVPRVREGGAGKYAMEIEFRLPERVARCVWHDQRLKKNALKTTDDKKLEVISQGEWNSGAGPDFRDAHLRVGGQELRGDVEIHTLSSGWRRHGHHKDAEYDNVVLHVFMWDDEKGVPPSPAAQLELSPFLDDDLTTIALTLDLENYPFSSLSRVGECNRLVETHSAPLAHLVRCAGQERLLHKARRFRRRIAAASLDAAAYLGFMEGMGYRPNKRAFAHLATLVPLETVSRVLRETPDRATGAATDAAEILQALFFHASGLYRNMPLNLWDPESRDYAARLEKHLEKWANAARAPRMQASEWKTAGARPANFPLRRMAGIAQLLASLEDGPGAMVRAFGRALTASPDPKGTRAAIRAFEEQIIQPGTGYWARHIIPGGKFTEKAPALIGPSLARALTLNTALPLLLCEASVACGAERADDEALEAAALRAFETFPALDTHQITRLMTYRLWGDHKAGVPAKREIYQQGLLQIFFDFCDGNIKDCAACAFPEMVRTHGEKPGSGCRV